VLASGPTASDVDLVGAVGRFAPHAPLHAAIVKPHSHLVTTRIGTQLGLAYPGINPHRSCWHGQVPSLRYAARPEEIC